MPTIEDWVPKALAFSPGLQLIACKDIICPSSYHHVEIQDGVTSKCAILTSDIAVSNKLFFVFDLVVSCLLPASMKMQQVTLLACK